MKTQRSIPLLGSFALLIASQAWAASPEVRARFDEAQAAYDLGQFDKARSLYAEAYELEPLPAFLFNVAQCERKLGHWSRAAFFYRRFLARAPDGVDTERVEQLAEQMEAKEKAARRVALLPKKVAPVSHPPPSAPPLISAAAEPEPLYRQRWVWAGAGVATLTVLGVGMAIGVAMSR